MFQKELYYSIIFAGGICFYLVDSNTKNKRKNQIPYIFLLLLALLLGSYPSGVVPTNIFYRVLKLSVDYDYLCQIWHYVAAVMFFVYKSFVHSTKGSGTEGVSISGKHFTYIICIS